MAAEGAKPEAAALATELPLSAETGRSAASADVLLIPRPDFGERLNAVGVAKYRRRLTQCKKRLLYSVCRTNISGSIVAAKPSEAAWWNRPAPFLTLAAIAEHRVMAKTGHSPSAFH